MELQMYISTIFTGSCIYTRHNLQFAEAWVYIQPAEYKQEMQVLELATG